MHNKLFPVHFHPNLVVQNSQNYTLAIEIHPLINRLNCNIFTTSKAILAIIAVLNEILRGAKQAKSSHTIPP